MFSQSIPSYCPKNALASAFMARAAYLDASEIADAIHPAMNGPALCHVMTGETTDTQVFAAGDAQNIVLSFRGTRDLRNWITDLDCERVAWPRNDGSARVEVHRGFCAALDSVFREMNEALLDLLNNNQNIFVTGHSLGGALAMLAAKELCDLGFHIGNVFTFGQPRVGNAAFRDAYDATLRERTFRLVHAEDVVARIPWLLGAYRHAGTEIFYDASGKPRVDLPWWKKLPDDACEIWRAWRHGQFALLSDHCVNTYIGLLSENPQSAIRNLQSKL